MRVRTVTSNSAARCARSTLGRRAAPARLAGGRARRIDASARGTTAPREKPCPSSISSPAPDLRVLVTAGASGIGAAIACAFHEAGSRVHVCDIDRVRARSPECRRAAASRAAWPTPRSPTTSTCVFDDVEGALGGLDVLVNDAGIPGPTGADRGHRSAGLGAHRRRQPAQSVLFRSTRRAAAEEIEARAEPDRDGLARERCGVRPSSPERGDRMGHRRPRGSHSRSNCGRRAFASTPSFRTTGPKPRSAPRPLARLRRWHSFSARPRLDISRGRPSASSVTRSAPRVNPLNSRKQAEGRASARAATATAATEHQDHRRGLRTVPPPRSRPGLDPGGIVRASARRLGGAAAHQ